MVLYISDLFEIETFMYYLRNIYASSIEITIFFVKKVGRGNFIDFNSSRFGMLGIIFFPIKPFPLTFGKIDYSKKYIINET
jgi:hypothetical protein